MLAYLPRKVASALHLVTQRKHSRSYGLSLELRHQGDTLFPFNISVVTGESGLRPLGVDAQRVDLVDGNGEETGKYALTSKLVAMIKS